MCEFLKQDTHKDRQFIKYLSDQLDCETAVCNSMYAALTAYKNFRYSETIAEEVDNLSFRLLHVRMGETDETLVSDANDFTTRVRRTNDG